MLGMPGGSSICNGTCWPNEQFRLSQRRRLPALLKLSILLIFEIELWKQSRISPCSVCCSETQRSGRSRLQTTLCTGGNSSRPIEKVNHMSSFISQFCCAVNEVSYCSYCSFHRNVEFIFLRSGWCVRRQLVVSIQKN